MPPIPTGATTSDPSSHGKRSRSEHQSPFVQRHGRRYLRDVPLYPLPVDLYELHRQTLRSSLLIEVFGSPFCSRLKRPPERILELICGSATWSLKCDQQLKKLGFPNVSFTGVDIAPLAPDLRKYGVNWRFIQHDLRKPPLPFGEEFDLIFVNDGTTVLPSAKEMQTNPIVALKKYLRPGGCVEVVETEYNFRCLQEEPAKPPGASPRDLEQAKKTATYAVGPATPFSKSTNRFILDYNKWVEKAFQDRDFAVNPCATMSYALAIEDAGYAEISSRRVAIPFTKIRWENDTEMVPPTGAKGKEIPPTDGQVGKTKGLTKPINSQKAFKPLTSDQSALRMTALHVAFGVIESMESILMKESGKKQDEWDRWWGAMMDDLFEKDGAYNGECLEAGVFWARKEEERAEASSSESEDD